MYVEPRRVPSASAVTIVGSMMNSGIHILRLGSIQNLVVLTGFDIGNDWSIPMNRRLRGNWIMR